MPPAKTRMAAAFRRLLGVAGWLLHFAAAAAYSESAAIEYSYLAGAAYCDAAPLQNWSCGASCRALQQGSVQNVTAIQGQRSDQFGFVARYLGQCVVSFRGTSNLEGWVHDLESLVSVQLDGCSYAGDDCRIGDGFMKNYNSLKDGVKGALDKLGCRSSKTVVVGHSLGAAEAAVAMWDLNRSGYPLADGYTFGQPRTGNKAFSEAFRAAGLTLWRVTHGEDPIVHLPPKALYFHHTATEVYYAGLTSDGHKVCDGDGEDKDCADQYWDVPVMLAKCLKDGERECDHLTYMWNARSFRLDSEGCGES